jgi:hypothetical protein
MKTRYVDVEAWDIERHAPIVEAWAAKRGVALDLSVLPNTGVFAGCAVGFLYLTNSKVAYIDSIQSDPDASLIRKGRALEALVRYLVDQADRHGRTTQVYSTAIAGALGGFGPRLGFHRILSGASVFRRRS